MVFGAIWGIALNTGFKDKEDKTEVVAEESKVEVEETKPELPTLSVQDMKYVNYMGEFIVTFKDTMDNLSENLTNADFDKPETIDVIQVNLLTIDAIIIGYSENVPDTVEFAETKELFDTSMKNYKGMVAVLPHAIEEQDDEKFDISSNFIKNGKENYKAGLDSMESILNNYTK